jgi:hypothetical protein
MAPIVGRPHSLRDGRDGAIAQLGERVVRNDEVGGSIPPGSTSLRLLRKLRPGKPRRSPSWQSKRRLPRRSPLRRRRASATKLASRGSKNATAQALWDRFIAGLEANPEPGFLAATPGELLHQYVASQLRLGLDPQHVASLRQYRVAIIGYHQQLLEHTNGDEELDCLEIVSNWMHLHLGPWP